MPTNHTTLHTRATLEAAGMIIPDVLFEEVIQRYEETDKTSPPVPGGIVFYGDSDIGYWNNDHQFQEDFEDLPAVNRGFGGARIWESLIYFRRVLVPHQPRILVYNCGDNDVCALGYNAEKSIRTGFELFLNTVETELPCVEHMIYIAIHPAPSRNDKNLWPLQEKANDAIRELCNERDWAQYEDALELLGGDPLQLNADDFLPDRTHYSPAFYSRLGRWLRPKLEMT